ncbi:MAG: 50S ribosomal protein L13 [Candidatus Paceibacterota bacterium]
MPTDSHTIDATGEKLGRLASQVATILMGKDRVDFARNQVADVTVTIENASKLDITADRLDNKVYDRFSGYPGGRKEETAREVVEKKGYGELIRRAVRGMLPDNKLKDPTMKNLIITE